MLCDINKSAQMCVNEDIKPFSIDQVSCSLTVAALKERAGGISLSAEENN